jgi:aldehyde:ferredoxin oxidoreductase
MAMGGYAGKFLYIDLTTGTIREQPLDSGFARENIGGLGFGAKIFLGLIKDKPDFDALSPDNPFVLMTGPLTGIRMEAVARWCVGAKSPLTGCWGDANAGGSFGARLKFAGYDGIVITGAAHTPTYIHIDDGNVELRDARKHWGQDVYAVTDELIAGNRAESREPAEVLAIGPAGENLVRFASIVSNKRHVAGRTGMGAVWGSKRLKAIFVRGTGAPDVVHPDRLKRLRAELQEVFRESIYIEALRSFGTASHMDVGIVSGDIPIKNWQQTDWELFDDIGPIAYEQKLMVGRKSCYGCSVACKREAEVKDGPFEFGKGPGPEYQTIATFGTLCLNANIESIGKANELCNRYGMDTISCGSTIAFAMECFEHGLISERDTDGVKLTWGNSEAIVAMVEKIGKREGFGQILSQGSARAAEEIGGNAADFLTTVKGLEAPMHDPRSAHGYGLAYAVSPRGACHVASLGFSIESGIMYLPEFEEMVGDLEELASEGKAELNIIAEDYGMFFSSCAVFCNLGAAPLSATQAVDMVNHVTGFDYTVQEVIELGRRIWYLKRGLSNLFGARAEDDRLPRRLMTPMEDGPTAGSVPDMDMMLREYYQLRGFNEDGVPRKDVLEEMGLLELAELLYRPSAERDSSSATNPAASIKA